MSRSVGLAHIIRHDDGASSGVWGTFELKTAFQPIFAFAGGKLSVVAFEGLIRPFHDGDAVSPSNFFSALDPADRMPVETLTRTLHLLNAAAFLPVGTSIFVNFNPSVFIERSVADAVLRDMRLVLHEAGIDPHRVVCEVTEQKSASEANLHAFVEALRASGFRIAVDDYGSEDSDIGRIRALRPDIVKFDAQWITHLMESGPGFGLLTAMVKIFRKQGVQTVFEGIEEIWQLELAERSGASMVQGFVLARPEIVPASFAEFSAASHSAGEQPLLARVEETAAPAIRHFRAAKTFGRRTAH
ncbi:MAG: EAL domain-containing protein [Pseudaminobacter sp.]|nr:EAL domain-containing protein [Pseudaminobacter sp.]